MIKENSPLLSDEFLDEITKEINEKYGGPEQEQIELPTKNGN